MIWLQRLWYGSEKDQQQRLKKTYVRLLSELRQLQAEHSEEQRIFQNCKSLYVEQMRVRIERQGMIGKLEFEATVFRKEYPEIAADYDKLS
jgi:hypothetical protein